MCTVLCILVLRYVDWAGHTGAVVWRLSWYTGA